MLTAADMNCPSRSSWKLSNANVENVVKPPSTPMSRNARASGLKTERCSATTDDDRRTGRSRPHSPRRCRTERAKARGAEHQRRKHVARHGAQRAAEPNEQKSHTRQNTDDAEGVTHAIVEKTRGNYTGRERPGTARGADRRTRRSGPGLDIREPRARATSSRLTTAAFAPDGASASLAEAREEPSAERRREHAEHAENPAFLLRGLGGQPVL